MFLKNFYSKIKNDTQKKLVFRIGTGAGFFSHYNNMILTIHYCLLNRLKFTLNSKYANFSKNGWDAYFSPFCDVDNHKLHARFNMRYQKPVIRGFINKIKYLLYTLHLLRNNIDLLTYDVFHEARKQQVSKIYSIESLGIIGTLQENCTKINSEIWHFKPAVKKDINNIMEKINLPKKYIGFHIRRGDKKRESDFIDIDTYINTAKKITNTKSAFIASDDYTTIELLEQQYPDWKFFTLTNKSQRGYDQYIFNKINPKQKHAELINLFATIEILSKSELFVGTLSSNIGMYMGWRMAKNKWVALDSEKWNIW